MTFSLKCPTCKKEVHWGDNPSRPFCSERCRTVDLGAWASGDYRLPCSDLSEYKEIEE